MSEASAQAVDLVNGERQKRYGSPWDNFCRNALIWMGQFGIYITPEQIALGMIGVKLGRAVHSPDFEDHWVDTHGYANTWEMVVKRRQELEALYREKGADALGFIDRLFVELELARRGDLAVLPETVFARQLDAYNEIVERLAAAEREIARLRDNALADDEERQALKARINDLEHAGGHAMDLFKHAPRDPADSHADGPTVLVQQGRRDPTFQRLPTAGAIRKTAGPDFRQETVELFAQLQDSLRHGYTVQSGSGAPLFDTGEPSSKWRRFHAEALFEGDMLAKMRLGWDSFTAPHAGALTPEELAEVLALYYSIEAQVVEQCMIVVKGLKALAGRLCIAAPLTEPTDPTEEVQTNEAQ